MERKESIDVERMRACECACMRAFIRACVRACVHAYVRTVGD